MQHRRQVFLEYALCGGLLGIGFVFPVLWPLGLLSVALFLRCLYKTNNRWEAALGGFVTWFIKYLLVISFLWQTYPAFWYGATPGFLQLFFIGFYSVSAAIFLGAGGVVLALLFFEIKERFNKIYGLIIFPFLLVISEVISSLIYSIGAYGAGGSVNANFGFGYLGYLIANHEGLITLAALGGVYALSFITAFGSYGLFLAWQDQTKEKIGLRALLVVILCWGTSFIFTSDTQVASSTVKTTVAIIDTNFSNEFLSKVEGYLEKDKQVREAVEAALTLKPTYILLPEDSRFTPARLSAETAYRMFRFQNADPTVVLIDSGRVPLPGGESFLRSTIYDGISKSSFVVDKQYLVPQGEFLPYFTAVTLTWFGAQKTAKELKELLSYRPGPEDSQKNLPSNLPGVLFCFESADPRGVRKLTKGREVPFIAHPISHARFHRSNILIYQQDLMLRTQAIWNKVAIVSAGNMADGALYTKEGKKVNPTKVLVGESWQISLVDW
jgi:apolipoprotein N-acyltransferase